MATAKTCSIDGLHKLREQHPEGFPVIVTQKGCPPCLPQMKALRKAVGKRTFIAEIPAEKAECDDLLAKLEVSDSPTVFWMKGSKTKRISDGTKGDEEVAAEVKALIGKRGKK